MNTNTITPATNAIKAGDFIDFDDVKPGFKFIGGDKKTYTVTDRTNITEDDTRATWVAITVEDDANTVFVLDLAELRAPAANDGKLKHGDDMPFNQGDQMGSMSHCALCLRKVGNNPLMVEVFDGGAIWDASRHGQAVVDGGYMGCYPIGSECAKKFAPGVLVEGSVA